MDLVSRLKRYLDSRQISVTQFADECSIPRPTGSQLLAGRNKKVSDEIISKIHITYPDLNIVWLMFGEGEMLVNSNIEISEPKNLGLNEQSEPEYGAQQTIGFEEDYNNDIKENVVDDDSVNTFTFATPSTMPNRKQSDVGARIDVSKENDSVESGSAFTVTPGKGKRVTGIVVYYDDHTYESFIPDPNHRHPFMMM